jgi:hypothetical protein
VLLLLLIALIIDYKCVEAHKTGSLGLEQSGAQLIIPFGIVFKDGLCDIESQSALVAANQAVDINAHLPVLKICRDLFNLILLQSFL